MSHVEQSETGRPARSAGMWSPGVWSPDAVLERGRWREQPPTGKGSASPPVLEQEERAGVRRRLSRAVAVPLLAGTAVFVLAVLIAILAVVLRPDAGGAELLAGEGTREPAVEEPGMSAAASSPGADASDSSVYVHVVGEVVRPGVVEVDGGTRVSEAIEAAGGATDAAMLSAVNLARAVVDGEQILVPDAEQARAGVPAGPGLGAGAGAGTAAGAAAGAGATATGPLDLNTADTAALETLPRVGPALAQRIIEWRTANGRFDSVEQLLEVPGIGSKILEGFRDLVRV